MHDVNRIFKMFFLYEIWLQIQFSHVPLRLFNNKKISFPDVACCTLLVTDNSTRVRTIA